MLRWNETSKISQSQLGRITNNGRNKKKSQESIHCSRSHFGRKVLLSCDCVVYSIPPLSQMMCSFKPLEQVDSPIFVLQYDSAIWNGVCTVFPLCLTICDVSQHPGYCATMRAVCGRSNEIPYLLLPEKEQEN